MATITTIVNHELFDETQTIFSKGDVSSFTTRREHSPLFHSVKISINSDSVIAVSVIQWFSVQLHSEIGGLAKILS